jgi:hypothetical protein
MATDIGSLATGLDGLVRLGIGRKGSLFLLVITYYKSPWTLSLD